MFSFNSLLTIATVAATVSANCIHGTSFHRREVTEEGKVEVSKFGYSDEQGPLNWAGLDPANAACATSKVQSPIVIDDSIQKASEAPVCKFDNVEEAEFENLGTTLETIVSGTTTFAGKDFALKQFHLHTPSEHRIKEEYFPMEMHMVHEAEDGSIAVIAIPFQLTEDSSTTELLTSVIQNIDAVKEPGTVTKTGALDFTELVNAVQTKPLFQYTGSLTTPPCAEGLTFLVMEEPMALNVKTFNTIKSVIKFNARYTQNKLENTNLIQVAAQKAELNCAAVGAETSPSPAVELKTGEQNMEEVKVEEPLKEQAQVEEPMKEEVKVAEPMKEEVKVETAMKEEPKVEAPMKEEPKVEAPMKEEPKVEAPMKEEPEVETPMTEDVKQPMMNEVKMEEVKAAEPSMMSETPKMEAPAMKVDAMEEMKKAPGMMRMRRRSARSAPRRL